MRREDVRETMADPVLPPPEEKPIYVRRMFTSIARRYDLMNRLMTGGRDRAWRRDVIRLAGLRPGEWLLDVATGTGDLGIEALRQTPGVHVVGLDFTREMMLVGRDKPLGRRMRFVEGDALQLPFPDGTFDAVVSGFGMRNVADLARAFAEQARVTRPGGRVLCLETTPPPEGIWGRLFRWYFFTVVPFMGGLLSGRRDAYAYLPHSTAHFPSPEAVRRVMVDAGLRHVRYRLLMGGTVAIHVGLK